MDEKAREGMTDEEIKDKARAIVEGYADTCRRLQMDTAKDIEKMRRRIRMNIR